MRNNIGSSSKNTTDVISANVCQGTNNNQKNSQYNVPTIIAATDKKAEPVTTIAAKTVKESTATAAAHSKRHRTYHPKRPVSVMKKGKITPSIPMGAIVFRNPLRFTQGGKAMEKKTKNVMEKQKEDNGKKIDDLVIEVDKSKDSRNDNSNDINDSNENNINYNHYDSDKNNNNDNNCRTKNNNCYRDNENNSNDNDSHDNDRDESKDYVDLNDDDKANHFANSSFSKDRSMLRATYTTPKSQKKNKQVRPYPSITTVYLKKVRE
eukprot:Awhi_evm1s7032